MVHGALYRPHVSSETALVATLHAEQCRHANSAFETACSHDKDHSGAYYHAWQLLIEDSLLCTR